MAEWMQVVYDKAGDILKITTGAPGKSKYHELGDGVFQCIDEKSKDTTAIAIFTFKKRMEAGQTIEIPASLRIKVNMLIIFLDILFLSDRIISSLDFYFRHDEQNIY